MRVFKAMVGPRKEDVIENRNCVFRSFMMVLLAKCAGDHIKMNGKCWTRGMVERRYAYTTLVGET